MVPSPCLPGFACPISVILPSLCPAGSFSLANATACALCAMGAFVASQGATACALCPIGTYSPAAGASACSTWPAVNSSSSMCAPGASAVAAVGGFLCAPCRVGAFCPDGAPTPLPCPVGFYCPSVGLTFPVLCPAQAYCPSSGLSMYVPCAGGALPSFQVMASPPGSVSSAQCQTANVTVSTLAGNGNATWVDGTGTQASLANPYGVAVDQSGNVIVGGNTDGRIRRITPAGGALSRPILTFCESWFLIPFPPLIVLSGFDAGRGRPHRTGLYLLCQWLWHPSGF